MAFMLPDYIIRRAWHVDTKNEGCLPFFAVTPFDATGGDEAELRAWFADLLGIDAEEIYEVSRDDYPGYYCRLSAPGYMDCTEWAGPFATLEEAKEHIADTYEVDAESGEELDAE